MAREQKLYYLGVDLHKDFSYFTLINQQGQVILYQKVVNQPQLLKDFLQKCQKLGKLQIVIEPVGWENFFLTICQDLGLEVKVDNPEKVKILAYGKLKTDKVDSYYLAQLLRTNLLPQVYLLDWQTRTLKNLVRYYYKFLLPLRTKIKIELRNILLRNQQILKKRDILGQESKQWLKEIKLDYFLDKKKENLLSLAECLQTKIKEIEEIIMTEAQKDEISQILKTIPGFSYFSALAIRLEIGDINRFSNYKSLINFVGLRPFIYQSGNECIYGKMVKKGNKFLKHLYYQASLKITKNNAPDLFNYYQKLINKGKPKKIARLNLARKLLKITYCLWKAKRMYQKREINNNNNIAFSSLKEVGSNEVFSH